ncbi:hypothetical protein [Bradyrhizobium sp. 179]|uniref:hypothetical protein n=1 Tax=Bradyrhizobium sp. 179 TaxID=2782648 RepID=UPI001FF86D86|nr:hypothetical protein [Bradyrhizobium sp. 179]
MADETILGRFDQHAEIGIGPFDISPGLIRNHVRAPDRLVQRLRDRPRGVAVQNVDFDAHDFLFRGRSIRSAISASKAMIFCTRAPSRANARAATIFAIVPSVRLTHIRKLAVFNGDGTFYKG